MADNVRSIPSVVDGLKPGQRKVLYGCYLKKLKQEIKVSFHFVFRCFLPVSTILYFSLSLGCSIGRFRIGKNRLPSRRAEFVLYHYRPGSKFCRFEQRQSPGSCRSIRYPCRGTLLFLFLDLTRRHPDVVISFVIKGRKRSCRSSLYFHKSTPNQPSRFSSSR